MVGTYSLRAWSALACLSFTLATRVTHAEEKISEEAKLYFQNGVELIQNQPPNYQDAYYQFKLAWDRSHSWKVLGNWGLCALKLERDGEAIWAYSEYLKKGGSDVDASERKDLERDLLLLNGNAATVTLTSAAPDFEVLDTRAGSSAPPQNYKAEAGQLTLRLRAGTHTLRASYQGKSVRWEVPLSPGNSENHAFEFSEPTVVPVGAAATVAAAPAPAAPLPAVTPPGSEPAQRGGGLRTAGYVSAGAGVVALGTGAVLGVLAKSKDSDARSECITVVSGLICPERTRAQFDSAKSQGSIATILLIGGGVFTAAGVGMIVLGGPKSDQPQQARLRISPILDLRQAGVFAQGAF